MGDKILEVQIPGEDVHPQGLLKMKASLRVDHGELVDQVHGTWSGQRSA